MRSAWAFGAAEADRPLTTLRRPRHVLAGDEDELVSCPGKPALPVRAVLLALVERPGRLPGRPLDEDDERWRPPLAFERLDVRRAGQVAPAVSLDERRHVGDILADPALVGDFDLGDRVVLHGRPPPGVIRRRRKSARHGAPMQRSSTERGAPREPTSTGHVPRPPACDSGHAHGSWDAG